MSILNREQNWVRATIGDAFRAWNRNRRETLFAMRSLICSIRACDALGNLEAFITTIVGLPRSVKKYPVRRSIAGAWRAPPARRAHGSVRPLDGLHATSMCASVVDRQRNAPATCGPARAGGIDVVAEISDPAPPRQARACRLI